MKAKFIFVFILLCLFPLAGCGSHSEPEDGIDRTAGAHTYEGYPVVYVIPDVSSQALLSAYEKLEVADDEKTVIRTSETNTDQDFDWPALIDKLTESLHDPAVAEAGSEADLSDYDCTIVLSHFKSDETVGFDGAVKALAAIPASPEEPMDLSDRQDELERLAEAAKRTAEATGGQILYINVMDRLTIESAGVRLPESNTYNIGILASYDPVALDQACLDFVSAVQEGDALAEHIESCNGIHTLVHAEQIGLGSMTYALMIAG